MMLGDLAKDILYLAYYPHINQCVTILLILTLIAPSIFISVYFKLNPIHDLMEIVILTFGLNFKEDGSYLHSKRLYILAWNSILESSIQIILT